MNTLEIINLHAKVEDTEILKGINLTIKSGEIHAIMGPNGSGKSTLCNVLMGHPRYEITDGCAKFNGVEINELSTTERANLGLFLGFQHPIDIPGVPLSSFLRLAKNANSEEESSPMEFMKELKETAENLKIDPSFIGRSVNEGLSGGERKRTEILQMAILKPKITLLDEVDSGLDIDALKAVAEGIKSTFEATNTGILLITHYQRILNYITPTYVHIMSKGKIVKSGGKELAMELEEGGYTAHIN